MPDWAQIISNALDILKFDGAVQDTLAELRESGKPGTEAHSAGIFPFRIRSEKVKVEESITVYKDAAERFRDE